ncbi:MAG: PIN domain-containing protein [Candidatus Freyarchaeota archaeon]|nr:PIN domain-containing protein [Candidatus Jordarchaeia archaeon]MBS7268926.1 PIN domain-containing protein [Candidatus Jordarchaeia archaeon]MBS7281634.1 PIN domain-containing protein [Candidatus Jordarchaeia archaeon]
MHSKERKGEFLLDSNVFLSYLKGDELSAQAEKVVKSSVEGTLEAFVSSMLYDDVISGLRSKGMSLNEVLHVLTAIASIPHTALPVTPTIAISALTLYIKHGGQRKLHYFDAYHVATARIQELSIITSDKYIVEHQKNLGITAIDLKNL